MTGLIAIPFIGEMIVAILSTKISLYLGTSLLPLPLALPQVGFWAGCTKYDPTTHRFSPLFFC
jgi:hypothetical protein